MLYVSYLLFNIVRYCHFVTFPLIHKSYEIQKGEVPVPRLVKCVHLGCGQCDAEGLDICLLRIKTSCVGFTYFSLKETMVTDYLIWALRP